MNRITCIIVDDQQAGVDLLSDHIQRVQELHLTASFNDPIEALSHFDSQPSDLIFLDIEMPSFSGIDFAESLKAKHGSKMPKIIFASGHEEYAIKGFEHGVTDYILKPVSYKRFKIAVDRIISGMDKLAEIPRADAFIFVESDSKKIKLNLAEIEYIEAAGNYATIVMQGKQLTIYTSMHTMQNILPAKTFFRIHKSFIASINYIQAVSGNELIMSGSKGQKKLPIGITYKESLLKKLKIC